MHRISRITTNFGGKSSTALLPPCGPQEKLQAGGFNDPLKGEFEVYQDKYLKPAFTTSVKTADFIAYYSSNWERDEKVQAVVRRRTGPAALIGDNIRDLWRPGPAAHISDRISSTSISSKTPIMIWMRIFPCCRFFCTQFVAETLGNEDWTLEKATGPYCQ